MSEKKERLLLSDQQKFNRYTNAADQCVIAYECDSALSAGDVLFLFFEHTILINRELNLSKRSLSNGGPVQKLSKTL